MVEVEVVVEVLVLVEDVDGEVTVEDELEDELEDVEEVLLEVLLDELLVTLDDDVVVVVVVAHVDADSPSAQHPRQPIAEARQSVFADFWSSFASCLHCRRALSARSRHVRLEMQSARDCWNTCSQDA